MSKLILVVDMPATCLVCPLKYKSEEIHLGNFTYQSLFRCEREPEGLCEDDGDTVYLNDIMMKSKPDWCPLREVPQKQTIHCTDTPHHRWAKSGYNACIDEILRGCEEGG